MTAEIVLAENWDRLYSCEQAAYPTEWVRRRKVWPSISRIDNVYGDRNLFVCIPVGSTYKLDRLGLPQTSEGVLLRSKWVS